MKGLYKPYTSYLTIFNLTNPDQNPGDILSIAGKANGCSAAGDIFHTRFLNLNRMAGTLFDHSVLTA